MHSLQSVDPVWASFDGPIGISQLHRKCKSILQSNSHDFCSTQMKRYSDTQELFEEVRTFLVELQVQYENARANPDVKKVLRPRVKSALEHLRSTLEYCTHDIRETFCEPPAIGKKIYFPYGRTENDFLKSIARNLPGLDTSSPDMYAQVTALQPFSCHDNWLIELCEQTNFIKHNGLGDQVRKNSPEHFTNLGNAVITGSTGTTIIESSMINGVPIGFKRPVVVRGSSSLDSIRKIVPKDIAVRREFEWVKFNFSNSAEDTLDLISRATVKISNFVEEVNKRIP